MGKSEEKTVFNGGRGLRQARHSLEGAYALWDDITAKVKSPRRDEIIYVFFQENTTKNSFPLDSNHFEIKIHYFKQTLSIM